MEEEEEGEGRGGGRLAAVMSSSGIENASERGRELLFGVRW